MAAEGGYTINLRELEAEPATRAASAVWRSNFERWAHAVISAAMRSAGTADGTAVKISDTALRLTNEEAQTIVQEMDDVVATWSERTRGRDPKRRTYLLMTALQPYPDLDSLRPHTDETDADG